MMTRKLLVGAIAAGALAVTAGTAVALANQDSSTTTGASATTTSSTSSSPFNTTSSTTSAPSSTSSGTSSPSSTVPVDPVISRDDAVKIAQDRVGGGDVTEIEQETEHGRPEWKIELHVNGVEHDVRIDARTGDVTRVDTDDDKHDDDRDDRDDKHDDDRDDD